MKAATPKPGAKRILVALDSSETACTALQVAADLAVEGRAELVGLYVEDLALLHAADLPVTSLIRRYGAEMENMGSAEIERGFRVVARDARAKLAEISDRLRIKSSFEVLRGLPSSEILAAARGFNLVAVGATGRAGTASQAGRIARALIQKGPCSLLIPRRPGRPRQSLTLLLDRSKERVSIADELKLLRPGALRVIVPRDVADPRALFDEATRSLLDQLGQLAIETPDEKDPTTWLRRSLQQKPTGVLMAKRNSGLARELEIDSLLSLGSVDSILFFDAAGPP